MRKIKFRAWDIKDLKLRPVTEVRFSSLGIKRVVMTGFKERFGDNVLLEQYTGLKDKNGVEIYEGDIVKGHPNSAVKFMDGGFFPFSIAQYDLSSIPEESEVIGNIHENPELLG